MEKSKKDLKKRIDESINKYSDNLIEKSAEKGTVFSEDYAKKDTARETGDQYSIRAAAWFCWAKEQQMKACYKAMMLRVRRCT